MQRLCKHFIEPLAEPVRLSIPQVGVWPRVRWKSTALSTQDKELTSEGNTGMKRMACPVKMLSEQQCVMVVQ